VRETIYNDSSDSNRHTSVIEEQQENMQIKVSIVGATTTSRKLKYRKEKLYFRKIDYIQKNIHSGHSK
jgi:hypothetical protein